MVRKRFLPEVRAALFLEHKADVGHKDPGAETGAQPTLTRRQAGPVFCYLCHQSAILSGITLFSINAVNSRFWRSPSLSGSSGRGFPWGRCDCHLTVPLLVRHWEGRGAQKPESPSESRHRSFTSGLLVKSLFHTD